MSEPPTPPPAAQYPEPQYPAPQYSTPQYPTPQRPPRARKRPSAWWFVPGAALLLVSAACIVVVIVQLVQVFHTDGHVLADASRHTVHLSGSEDHALFAPDHAEIPRCRVFADGTALPLTADDSLTISDTDDDWVSFAGFTTSADEVQVVCVSDQRVVVRVGGTIADGGAVFIGIAALGAVGSGLLGFAGLVVIAVLFFTRPRRTATG